MCVRNTSMFLLCFCLYTGFNVGSLRNDDSGIGNSISDSQFMSQGEEHIK